MLQYGDRSAILSYSNNVTRKLNNTISLDVRSLENVAAFKAGGIVCKHIDDQILIDVNYAIKVILKQLFLKDRYNESVFY